MGFFLRFLHPPLQNSSQSNFHCIDDLNSMSSKILTFTDKDDTKSGLKVADLEIQLLDWIWILSLLSTLHLVSFYRTNLPHKILPQKKDGLEPVLASRKSVCLKYLAFNTLATNESGYWISLHPCFATKAWLKLKRSLKLNPTSNLDITHLSHFAKWILFLASFDPYQNLAIALYMSLHNPREILNTLME